MIEFLFNSLWGWLSVTAIIVIACGLVAWFVPPFRKLALMIGGVALAAATIYSKGQRDRAALEQRRKDEAVTKVRKKYDEIEKRPDTPDDVDRRLSDRSF